MDEKQYENKPPIIDKSVDFLAALTPCAVAAAAAIFGVRGLDLAFQSGQRYRNGLSSRIAGRFAKRWQANRTPNSA
jgi:hypothetical protein